MRPCPRCRAPLQNRDATCPHCGAVDSAQPKPNTDPPPKPPRGNRIWTFYFLLEEFGPLALVVILALLALPVAVGYVLAGKLGAGIGVVAAIAILIGVAIWGEGE